MTEPVEVESGCTTPPLSSELEERLRRGLEFQREKVATYSASKVWIKEQMTLNSHTINAIQRYLGGDPEGALPDILSALEALKNRNELLFVGDKDPDVFKFAANYEESESVKSTNPAVAAYIKETESSKKKFPQREPVRPTQPSAWRRFSPYPSLQQPFRGAGPAWQPGPGPSFRPNFGSRFSSTSLSGQFERRRGVPQMQRQELDRGTCHKCGGVGHFKAACPSKQ